MTDEQIERVITAMIPDLRAALKAILSTGAGVHIFTCAEGTNLHSGIKSTLRCFIAQENFGVILEATAKGLADAQKLYLSQMAQMGNAGVPS